MVTILSCIVHVTNTIILIDQTKIITFFPEAIVTIKVESIFTRTPIHTPIEDKYNIIILILVV